MTETTARRVADGILIVAGLGAAYYIIKTPRLRRMAVGLAATMLTSKLPGWLSAEIGRAWAASDGRPHLRQGSGGQEALAEARARQAPLRQEGFGGQAI